MRDQVSKLYYQPKSKDELLTCGCGAKVSQKLKGKHLRSAKHQKKIIKLMNVINRKINPNPTDELEIKNIKDAIKHVEDMEYEGVTLKFSLGTDFKKGMLFTHSTVHDNEDAGFGYYDSCEENTDDDEYPFYAY
jgi:hypothetical protein